MSQSNPLDTQIGGSHYKGVKLQPIEFSEKYQLSPCEFSIVRYITRWRKKNGIEDLEKVQHYLQLLLHLAREGIMAPFPVGLECPPVVEFLDQFTYLTTEERAIAREVVCWRYPVGEDGSITTEGLKVCLSLIKTLIQQVEAES